MIFAVGTILVTTALFLLISVKADRQMEVLLEGKLYKQSRKLKLAASTSRKHKHAASLIFFAAAGAAGGISVLLLALGHSLFLLSAIV